MLSDLTENEFIKGIKSFCLAHKEIYPNTNIIAYIREYAHDKPDQLSASEAWENVLENVRRYGYYRQDEVKYLSDDIKKAVDCVGYKAICLSETIGVERAHFMKAYEALISRENKKELRGE